MLCVWQRFGCSWLGGHMGRPGAPGGCIEIMARTQVSGIRRVQYVQIPGYRWASAVHHFEWLDIASACTRRSSVRDASVGGRHGGRTLDTVPPIVCDTHSCVCHSTTNLTAVTGRGEVHAHARASASHVAPATRDPIAALDCDLKMPMRPVPRLSPQRQDHGGTRLPRCFCDATDSAPRYG